MSQESFFEDSNLKSNQNLSSLPDSLNSEQSRPKLQNIASTADLE